MDTPAGRERIWNVLALCLQAGEQGLLSGDCNIVQIAALAIVKRYGFAMDGEELRRKLDVVDDLFMMWLSVEHYEVYEDMERTREQAKLDERDPDAEILAEDMSELLSMVMAMEE